jgi:hypothetical protein
VAFSSLAQGTIAAINAQVYPNGGQVKAVGSYANWSDTPGMDDWPTVKARLDAQNAAGVVPVLSWSTHMAACTETPAVSPDRCIADGNDDTYLDTWAQNFKALPYTVVIRLDWEMNGSWYVFSPYQNGNTPADFIALWQHVHDAFASNGVTNVRWFWCPNTSDGVGDFTRDYPGDAYVDYVGVDLYNWGTFLPGVQWKSFTELMTQSYQSLTTITTSKPYILGEIGTCDTTYSGGAGTKEDWITSTFLTEIPTSFPRITAFMWFNEFKAPAECSWKIDSTPASLAAFQKVAASPLWQAGFPQ